MQLLLPLGSLSPPLSRVWRDFEIPFGLQLQALLLINFARPEWGEGWSRVGSNWEGRGGKEEKRMRSAQKCNAALGLPPLTTLCCLRLFSPLS